MEEVSSITPLALCFLAVMSVLTFGLPRPYAFIPLLITASLMPLGQIIVAFGLNFHLFRVLLVIGVIRVCIRQEASQVQWVSFDRLFIGWVVASLILGVLSKPSMDLLINRSGDAFNAMCTYFFLRSVIAEWPDVIRSIQVLAVLSIPVAILLIVEKTTGRNLLSVFGGVPEFTVIREDRLRCQGAFRHPILTGTFGATLFPLMIAMWFYDRRLRALAIAGAISATIIMIASASSGPLLAWLFSIAGLLFWRYRQYTRQLRWGIVFGLMGLALVMDAPVYYIIAHISDITGGTGWHRSYLIDVALRHFNEWWLVGTSYTAHWDPGGRVIEGDPNHMDITNHFIMEGVKGGMVKLGLFVAMIVYCFRNTGQRLFAVRRIHCANIMVWGLGVSLLAHCVSFISVPYFDQIIVFWYWLLAVIVLPVEWRRRILPHFQLAKQQPIIARHECGVV